MCGICGEVRFDGAPVSTEDLLRMRESLVHRGPDADGLYVSADGRAGLAFRRLRIIDLTPRGNQPMGNEDGSVQVVFNGEIYNYLDLRRDLEARHRFRSRSDTEVIVHLYEEKGVEAIADLDGMFALAIWDQRQRRLLLARDRAGKKPLFLARNRDRLIFASEIKAFFQRPDIAIEPDADALPSYFIHGYVPCPGTLYRGIEQVEPGTYVTVGDTGTVASGRYWQLRLASRQQLAEARRVDLPEAAARVRELVDRAVTRRLVSDVPVGAFLSGGIDSSIVVGVMSRHMATPVKTFSIGFEGDAAYDETTYARMVAERFGTDHTEFRVSPSAIDLVEKLVWHHDGPFGDASAVPTYILSQLTRQHVTVALNGDGCDEVFAGYVRFRAGAGAERVPASLRRLTAFALGRLPKSRNDRHLLSRVRRFADAAALPLHERMTQWVALFYDDVEGLFSPDYRAAVSPVDRLRYLRPELPVLAPLSPLGQLLHVNFRSYLLDDLLVKVDRCSMANSLETRSPFLDRELVDYVATLPDHFKIKGLTGKVVLREAFADMLPDAIKKRPKMGFGVPLNTWFRGDLRDYLREMLLASDARYVQYLSRRRVEDLVQRHDSGQASLGLQLWTLLTFEVWLRLLSDWTSRPTRGDQAVAVCPTT